MIKITQLLAFCLIPRLNLILGSKNNFDTDPVSLFTDFILGFIHCCSFYCAVQVSTVITYRELVCQHSGDSHSNGEPPPAQRGQVKTQANLVVPDLGINDVLLVCNAIIIKHSCSRYSFFFFSEVLPTLKACIVEQSAGSLSILENGIFADRIDAISERYCDTATKTVNDEVMTGELNNVKVYYVA